MISFNTAWGHLSRMKNEVGKLDATFEVLRDEFNLEQHMLDNLLALFARTKKEKNQGDTGNVETMEAESSSEDLGMSFASV